MSNNQTIDGVLVSRELLDDLAGYGEGGKVPEPWMVEKLRALLDAPAKSEFLQSCEAAHLGILKHCKPVAQPQGEPVAVVMPVRLTDNYGESEQVIYAQGWNACLDEVTRLNAN